MNALEIAIYVFTVLTTITALIVFGYSLRLFLDKLVKPRDKQKRELIVQGGAKEIEALTKIIQRNLEEKQFTEEELLAMGKLLAEKRLLEIEKLLGRYEYEKESMISDISVS